MLDTLRIVSPALTHEAAAALVARGIQRSAVDTETGEVLYNLTTAELLGSYDHRIMLKLEGKGAGSNIVLEGSVHKQMLGHNAYGGSTDPVACARFLVARVEALVGCSLPAADLWTCRKADWANVYDLGSYEAVEGYFRALQGVSYPRRKVARYSFESIHVPGRMTTIKLYHKGPEFSAHDFKRLKERMPHGQLEQLQQTANKLLRSEVSIRRRMVEDFGCWPLVSQLTGEYLERIHDAEIARLVREGCAEMETVRKYLEVKARLYDVYSEGTARAVLGTWMQLAAMSEKETKKGMKESTFYLHRKQILDAGCSWHSADIRQGAQIFPIDFLPVSSDRRACKVEAPEVTAHLEHYRQAG